MKKMVGFFGVAAIVATLFLNTSFAHGQLTMSGPGECAKAYKKCDAAYPDDWYMFSRCMHIEAACDEE